MTLLAVLHFDSSVCILLYIGMNLPRPLATAELGLCHGLERGHLPSLWEVVSTSCSARGKGKQPECLNLLDSGWTIE